LQETGDENSTDTGGTFHHGMLHVQVVSVTNDTEKPKLTFKQDDKDVTLVVDKTATFQAMGKKNKSIDLPNGIKSITKGSQVTITTDKRDDVEVVTKIVTQGKAKGKAKKAKKAK
jgi:hypothetical protein